MMDKEIKIIQEKLLNNLERLNDEKANVSEEVARSNATSQLANTYIKTCNLIIRVNETKDNIRNKLGDIINDEK